MLIRDSHGSGVYGTNTQILGEEVKNEAGLLCRVVFLLDCCLPPGCYSITAALSRTQTTGYHFHWVDRATLFDVADRTPWSAPRVNVIGLKSVVTGPADPDAEETCAGADRRNS